MLSQQVAVNATQHELADAAGLFAVNGPPGTGKTTALRDDFAAVVVERARRLAVLQLPSKAFTADKVDSFSWKSAEYTRTVRPLKPEYTGFEMVLASANNGAVENISTQIPARAALGSMWRDDADYFAEQATRLLKGVPAWGAVAARLGSKKNRIEFVNRFWHGKEKPSDTAAAPSPARGPPSRSAGSTPGRACLICSGSGLRHRRPECGVPPGGSSSRHWTGSRSSSNSVKPQREPSARSPGPAVRFPQRVSASWAPTSRPRSRRSGKRWPPAGLARPRTRSAAPRRSWTGTRNGVPDSPSASSPPDGQPASGTTRTGSWPTGSNRPEP
ncbi:hypothetical protein GXW82_32915 [Streptacidiphilus sp. 4-A2]|nr:hypothetical protein [Streptacidiphilus sp. 4-A2]